MGRGSDPSDTPAGNPGTKKDRGRKMYDSSAGRDGHRPSSYSFAALGLSIWSAADSILYPRSAVLGVNRVPRLHYVVSVAGIRCAVNRRYGLWCSKVPGMVCHPSPSHGGVSYYFPKVRNELEIRNGMEWGDELMSLMVILIATARSFGWFRLKEIVLVRRIKAASFCTCGKGLRERFQRRTGFLFYGLLVPFFRGPENNNEGC